MVEETDGSRALDARDGHHPSEPHESPPVMTWPLIVLAVPAVIAGFVNTPVFGHGLQTLLTGALPGQITVEAPKWRWGIVVVSTALPLAGIAFAWAIYSAQLVSAASLRRFFGPVDTLLENKFYIDDLYERVIVGLIFYRGICGACEWFDAHVVDAAVNGIGRIARGAGGLLRLAQTGQVQSYGLFGFAGVAIAAILVLVLR